MANAIIVPYLISSVVTDERYAETQGFDQKTNQLSDCLIRSIYSIVGTSIFTKFDRVGKDQNTWMLKYDIVMKSNVHSNADDLEGYKIAQ